MDSVMGDSHCHDKIRSCQVDESNDTINKKNIEDVNTPSPSIGLVPTRNRNNATEDIRSIGTQKLDIATKLTAE